MHRMRYHHTVDEGLLCVGYDMQIEFGFSCAEPGDRINPDIPAEIFDEKIVSAWVAVGTGKHRLCDVDELRDMNVWLDPSQWNGETKMKVEKFVGTVHAAIAEHLNNQDQAARESAADARFQAMRDGE